MIKSRRLAALGVAAVVGAGALAFIGAAPAMADTYLTGTTYCAGGPTHYAGVSAYMNTGNSYGSVVFDNLDTGAQTSEVVSYTGGYHSVYSGWSSTKWELAMMDTHDATSVCS